MTRLLRREEGTALLSAIVLLGVMLMLGLAVAAQSDSEQLQSGTERMQESALGVGEAALNAQVFQIGANFPYTAAEAFPASCTPGATGTACPDGSDFNGYGGGDYGAKCNGATPTKWTTTVRDNVTAGATDEYYDASAVNLRPRWDANSDGILWVRADGRAGCRTRSLVTQVSSTKQDISFPRNVVTANGFSTSNNGNKTIIDTQGVPPYDAPQPADVSLRCDGIPDPNLCAQYQRNKGQLSPDTLRFDPGTTPLLAASQLAAVKALARRNGTYFPANGPCPSTLTGEAVYVEDLSLCPGTPRAANSLASPGLLVVGRGTFTITGNDVFYGVVYMRNEQGATGAVLTIQGTAAIVGSVAVDGRGTVVAGSSKENIVYDTRSANLVQGLSSAAAVPNTWRELTRGQ